jgi:DNA-binding phage protein
LSGHGAADVEAVIQQRCEVEVAAEVCAEIHRAGSKSMRSVIDSIRAMERYARTNGITRFTLKHYRAMTGKPSVKRAEPRQEASVAAIGGAA